MIKTIYQGKERLKDGRLRDILRMVREAFVEKKHSHERENSRRRRQIAQGILKVSE